MHLSRLSRRSFLAASLAAPCCAAQWPGFRGWGDSCAVGNDYPLEWSREKNLAWEAPLPGYGQSSPIVQGSQVFLTTLEGSHKETLSVLSLSLETGDFLWRRDFSPTQRIEVNDMVSRAAPTPAVDADSVYVFFETGEFLGLSHTGELRWKRSLVKEYGEFQGRHGIGSSLRLSRSGVLVLAAHDGPSFLLSADKKTGETLWMTERPPGIAWSTPAVCEQEGEEIVLVSGGDGLNAYGEQDGRRIWGLDGMEGNRIPSPTPFLGGVIIGSSKRGHNLAIRFPTAGEDRPRVLWKAKNATTYFCSVLAHRNHAYFVNKAGVAYCLDLATGTERWTQRLKGQNWVSPIGGGERVYFFSMRHGTEVLQASGYFEKLAENPPLASGRLYGVAAVDSAFLLRYGRSLVKVVQPVTLDNACAKRNTFET